MKVFLFTSAFIIAMNMGTASAKECRHIKEEEIMSAQTAWGEGIVAIGKASDHRQAALDHLNNLYAYGIGPVLFKPTKAAEDQFRSNKDEALSYFVTGIVPEDKGFALAPYTDVRFENEGMSIDCDSALAMGNYYFTTTEGKEIKVEYSFGYLKDQDGNLRINLHHSSLPYSP